MIAVLPVQGAVLNRGNAARRGDLGDVDVGEIVFRIFGDGKCDGCERDGAAEKPAYALLLRGQ